MKKILWICGLGIIFLILAVLTSNYTLSQAKSSIAAIGPVSLTDSSLEEIETATQKYADLKSGIGASILFKDAVNDYVDYDKLSEAQNEYISLKIDEISESTAALNEDDLIDQIILIRETITQFYPDEEYDGILNYSTFEALEEEYDLESTSE